MCDLYSRTKATAEAATLVHWSQSVQEGQMDPQQHVPTAGKIRLSTQLKYC